MAELYPYLVFAHILAFVFWLGADLGVAILGEAFRNRAYPLQTRLTILQLLVVTDMGPRTAWVAMVPLSISMLAAGGYWPDAPVWLVIASWAVGAVWLWLLWAGHLAGQSPKAAPYKVWEFRLKIALTAFYLWLGGSALAGFGPLEANWLGWKALLFAAVFAAAILIDVAFKPVGPLLGALIEKGSSDETEIPLRKAMGVTRFWVWTVYLLIFVIAFLGTVKPF